MDLKALKDNYLLPCWKKLAAGEGGRIVGILVLLIVVYVGTWIMADGFSEAAFYAISGHGVAHFSADSDADAGRKDVPRKKERQKMGPPDATSATLHSLVIRGPPEPQRPGKKELALGQRTSLR